MKLLDYAMVMDLSVLRDDAQYMTQNQEGTLNLYSAYPRNHGPVTTYGWGDSNFLDYYPAPRSLETAEDWFHSIINLQAIRDYQESGSDSNLANTLGTLNTISYTEKPPKLYFLRDIPEGTFFVYGGADASGEPPIWQKVDGGLAVMFDTGITSPQDTFSQDRVWKILKAHLTVSPIRE